MPLLTALASAGALKNALGSHQIFTSHCWSPQLAYVTSQQRMNRLQDHLSDAFSGSATPGA